MLGALAILILLPVENRKYVPSERRIRAGSWEFPQTPEHAPGFAYALIKTAKTGMSDRIWKMENMMALKSCREQRPPE